MSSFALSGDRVKAIECLVSDFEVAKDRLPLQCRTIHGAFSEYDYYSGAIPLVSFPLPIDPAPPICQCDSSLTEELVVSHGAIKAVSAYRHEFYFGTVSDYDDHDGGRARGPKYSERIDAERNKEHDRAISTFLSLATRADELIGDRIAQMLGVSASDDDIHRVDPTASGGRWIRALYDLSKAEHPHTGVGWSLGFPDGMNPATPTLGPIDGRPGARLFRLDNCFSVWRLDPEVYPDGLVGASVALLRLALRKAEAGDYGKLYEALIRDQGRALVKKRLLEYMRGRDSATHDEIAKHVHDNEDTDSHAIQENASKVNQLLENRGIPVRFDASGGTVTKRQRK